MERRGFHPTFFDVLTEENPLQDLLQQQLRGAYTAILEGWTPKRRRSPRDRLGNPDHGTRNGANPTDNGDEGLLEASSPWYAICWSRDLEDAGYLARADPKAKVKEPRQR